MGKIAKFISKTTWFITTSFETMHENIFIVYLTNIQCL